MHLRAIARLAMRVNGAVTVCPLGQEGKRGFGLLRGRISNMSVVSVCSTKGGVGKTTLVICLADAFARHGGHVAIIDCADPNGHVHQLAREGRGRTAESM